MLSIALQLAEKEYLSKMSADIFKDLFNQVISVVLDPRLSNYPDGNVIIQELNLSLAKVIQLGNPTNSLWYVKSVPAICHVS